MEPENDHTRYYDLLRNEVQRIDDDPASVLRAIDLMMDELLHPKVKEMNYLPKSIEYSFFEEFSKRLINWMGKGEFAKLKDTFLQIKERMKKDDDFISPFRGGSSKKRFGAYLNICQDMIEIYLRSDMELKDALKIMGPKANHFRQRGLLVYLYKQYPAAFFPAEFRTNMPCYADENGKKLLERDLKQLVEYDFLQKEYESSKSIHYRLTTKAWFWRAKIEECFYSEKPLTPTGGHGWPGPISTGTESAVLRLAGFSKSKTQRKEALTHG